MEIPNDYRIRALEEFVKARDEAITAAVVDGDLSLMRKMNVYSDEVRTADDTVLRAAACKGCLQITTMPEDVKAKARKWLLDRGLSLEAW